LSSDSTFKLLKVFNDILRAGFLKKMGKIGRNVKEYKTYRLIPIPTPSPSFPSLPLNCIFNHFLFIRGLSCPRSVQTSLSQNCLKLTIPRFPHILLLVSWLIRKKCIGQVLAWKSASNCHFAFKASCPLQTIPLSDFLVGHSSPLQIVMAI
jgi:hypothetical protein